MRTRPTILFYAPDGAPVPALVRHWAQEHSYPLTSLAVAEEIESIVLRGHPCVLFLDAERAVELGLGLVRRLKGDAFTAIVPVVALADEHKSDVVREWFSAGADEVLTGFFSADEQRSRIEAMRARTERDVRRRLETGEEFAVCYADLDHFKEYNDRYSYYDGDRVIYLLSRLLHDVVKGLLGARGFVGHIGGDDFIFIVPATEISVVCTEILNVFDTLIPLQYSDQDRRAGYFFGKDRRGQLHRVPLMTLSIGIVTNRNRKFTHPAQVSELATEMKSYAKTLPGSVFVVDRRRGTAAEEGA